MGARVYLPTLVTLLGIAEPGRSEIQESHYVRAKLVTDPISYPWSSAKAHVEERDNSLVKVSPLLELVPEWKGFLGE